MSAAKPDSRADKTNTKNPLLLTTISALSLVLLLLLMAYISQSFETLEDKLRFQPPNVNKINDDGSFDIEVTEGRTVYVPVYSHIYSAGGQPNLLEATLSIRNSDPDRSILIQSVRYYDSKGQLVEDYLKSSVDLGPLETTSFLIKKRDVRGGSGANFIVVWNAVEPVYEPIIEAVMIGTTDKHGVSFVSPGRALIQRQE